jgi:uncharacterized protein
VVKIPVGDAFTLHGEAALHPGAPMAIVCHPHPAFGGRLTSPVVVAIAEALHAARFSTLRFNFRGLDGSGGKATGGFEEHGDVLAACAWARAQGAPRIILVGYSFGALMCIKAMAQGERPHAYVAVGFPTTILGDHQERLADVARALDAGVPSLFVHGDQDTFCEHERVRAYRDNRSHVTIEELAGFGHFFQQPWEERELVSIVTRFVEGDGIK